MALPDLVAGDTNSVIMALFRRASDNGRFDLTGTTQNVRFWYGSAPATVKPMVVLGDPLLGVAIYRFEAGELVAGTLEADAEVIAGGRTLTTLEVRALIVRPKHA